MTIDVILYCPLHEEIKEVQKFFPLHSDFTDKYGFLAYQSDLSPYRIIVCSLDEMGVSTAQSTIRRLKADFNPKLIVCLGIGGTLSGDLRIGDVCFSQEIIDINENQKVERGSTSYQPKSYNSNNAIDKLLGLSGVHPTLLVHHEIWQSECAAHFDTQTAGLPVEITATAARKPIALKGPIVCGPVVADKKFKGRLKGLNRKVLVIETESSGIYQAIDPREEVEVIAIRGVSDLADDTKAATEVSGKKAFRVIAARNAASFLLMNLINNNLFSAALSQEVSLPLPGIGLDEDPIERILREQGDEIETSLHDLSPEYRAREKGYVLPVPRVRNGKNGDQLEPIDFIAATKAGVLEVPTSYPDKGMPWLYAKYLLGRTLSGKIVVPIVISGSLLRPPLHTLTAEMEKRCPGVTTNSNLLPVAIVTDLGFGNERKVSLILDEMKTTGFNTIIIGNGSQKGFFTANQKYESWHNYSLCDVSFSSIVDFISTQFSIAPKEAEVIAVRLSETFRAFNISAHPSYFAGIPKEMLARLSDANHRAELIDLAVTGFLSFIGAGDTRDVSLKQRTRRLFLRDLAFRLVVEKERITLSGLISYVKEYSIKHDFGLNAIEFVNSFIENGILHESGDDISFSIAFIQNYLVAERLTSEPDIARRYFDPSRNEIDFSTFELYAEIGLSDAILSDVSERLSNAIGEFKEKIASSPYTAYLDSPDQKYYKSSGHMLINGSIKPKLLSDTDRVVNYQGKIEQAARDLIGPSSDLHRKQKVLDLTHTAQEEAKSKTSVDADESPAAIVRNELLTDWLMATLMLGAAAEELSAEIKRKLAKDIITVAALVSDDWLLQVSTHDFDSVKVAIHQEILNDEDGDEQVDDEKAKKLADLIVDVVEMGHLSAPLNCVMSCISEYARNRVLYESIKNVEPTDVIQELFFALWKMELREADGFAALKDALIQLPKDRFLRMQIASYLVNRAYWYRGSENARGIFAAASDAALKPLNIKLPVDSEIPPVD